MPKTTTKSCSDCGRAVAAAEGTVMKADLMPKRRAARRGKTLWMKTRPMVVMAMMQLLLMEKAELQHQQQKVRSAL